MIPASGAFCILESLRKWELLYKEFLAFSEIDVVADQQDHHGHRIGNDGHADQIGCSDHRGSHHIEQQQYQIGCQEHIEQSGTTLLKSGQLEPGENGESGQQQIKNAHNNIQTVEAGICEIDVLRVGAIAQAQQRGKGVE